SSISNNLTLKTGAKASGTYGTPNVIIDGTITLGTNLTVKTLTINNSASLSASTYTITINNTTGGSVTVFTNNGTFTAGTSTVEFKGNSTGTIHQISGTVTFNNVVVDNIQLNFGGASTIGSRLKLNNSGYLTNSNAPNYTAGGTLEVNTSLSNGNMENCLPTGSGSTVPTHILISSGTVSFNNGREITLKGSFTVASGATFNGTNTCISLSSAFSAINNSGTCNLGRIYVLSGATWTFNADYTLSTMIILAGGTVNAGAYTLTLTKNNNTGCTSYTSNIFTMESGGTFNAGAGMVVFNPINGGDEVAANNVSGGIVFNNVTVNGPGDLVIPNSNTMTVNGNITVNSGADVVYAPNVNFGAQSSVTNNSNVNGTTNSFPPTVPSGTSGNGGGSVSTPQMVLAPGLTLTSNLTVNGTRKVVIVRSDAFLNAGTYTVACDSVYVYGTFTTTNANGLSGTFGSAAVIVGAASTINYSATTGTQNITLRTDYVNVSLSGAAAKSFATGTYEIAGNYSVTGTSPTYNVNSIMRFDGTTQTIACPTFNKVEFTNSGTKTLSGATSVNTTLTMAGSTTLATGNNLVLVSSSSGTASIAAIPGTATITGNVTVQRYVPALVRRSRMISPNVRYFTFTDLKDDIFVTGTGGATNGFDASGPNQTTVYTYQESTTGGRGWKAISNINNTLTPGLGALVFVRGDRTLSSPQWYTAPYVSQNEVLIDFVGPVNIGDITPVITYTNTGVPANDGFNMVGNPYPSAISWSAITKSNLAAFYYVYDPATGSYVANDNTVPIASGQAFLVQATAASPSLTFTESCKTTVRPTYYFKTASNPFTVKMVKDSLNADVAFLAFGANANRGLDLNEDALKMTNSVINLGFYIDNNTMLQFNRTPDVQTVDTFTLNAIAASGTYTLEFSYLNTIPSNQSVYLRDLFTNTFTNLRSASTYTFSITSNSASKGNRFQIITGDPSLLPVKWLSVSAEMQNEDAIVKWSTASEKNNAGFTVERSMDAKEWETAGIVSSAGYANAISNYTYKDTRPFDQHSKMVYYRIKQTDKNGDVSYSRVVNVTNATQPKVSVGVYPNPAKDVIHVTYEIASTTTLVEVYDMYGKLILTEKANTGSANNTINIESLPQGMYTLKIMQDGMEADAIKFIKE
ncbi:MAG: T9SS type A sorting domain-containing protein, partial [Bacteroidota bacterium]